MGIEINLSGSLSNLLRGVPMDDDISGEIFSNVEYMPPLAGYDKDGNERPGHSSQAPDGWYRPNEAAVQTYHEQAIGDAVERIEGGANPFDALAEGVTDSTMFALREFTVDVPIDTGRAMGSLQAHLPDGRETDSVQEGFADPPKPPEQSRWKDKAFVKQHRARKKAGN